MADCDSSMLQKHSSNCLICNEEILGMIGQNADFFQLSASNLDSVSQMFQFSVCIPEPDSLVAAGHAIIFAFCPTCSDRMETFKGLLEQLNALVMHMENLRQETKTTLSQSCLAQSRQPYVTSVRRLISARLAREYVQPVVGVESTPDQSFATLDDVAMDMQLSSTIKEEIEDEVENADFVNFEPTPSVDPLAFEPAASPQKTWRIEELRKQDNSEIRGRSTAVDENQDAEPSVKRIKLNSQHDYGFSETNVSATGANSSQIPEYIKQENIVRKSRMADQKSMRTPHPGQDPSGQIYQCTLCVKICKLLSHLKLHMERMHPEVPYQSDVPHLRVESPFRCTYDVCNGEPFCDYRTLQTHCKKVHSSGKYRCTAQGCELFFAKRVWMEKHRSSSHS